MRTIAENLVDKMLRAYPYCVVNVETAFKFIEKGGHVNVEQFKNWLETNGYWLTYYNS